MSTRDRCEACATNQGIRYLPTRSSTTASPRDVRMSTSSGIELLSITSSIRIHNIAIHATTLSCIISLMLLQPCSFSLCNLVQFHNCISLIRFAKQCSKVITTISLPCLCSFLNIVRLSFKLSLKKTLFNFLSKSLNCFPSILIFLATSCWRLCHPRLSSTSFAKF